MTVLTPEAPTAVPDLTPDQLADLQPACEFDTCEVGNPAAQWICRGRCACSCTPIVALCCEPCRLAIIDAVATVRREARRGVVFACRACGTGSPNPPDYTFEPLHPGR